MDGLKDCHGYRHIKKLWQINYCLDCAENYIALLASKSPLWIFKNVGVTDFMATPAFKDGFVQVI